MDEAMRGRQETTGRVRRGAARDRRRLWILAGTDGDDPARRTALIARLRELGAGASPK